MKFISILLLTFSAAFTQADETCLFGPPCPPPPTQADMLAADEVFNKARYALGAVYDAKSKKYYGEGYKNIPDYVQKTARLKQDILLFHAEAKKLNKQAGGVYLPVIVFNMSLCLNSYASSEFCSQSLSLLKDYLWNKEFPGSWSDYPTNKPWSGFPDE